MRARGSFWLLGLLVVVASGCDGRLVPVTAPFERDFTFTFDSDDGTTEVATLTESDIVGELDIPDDGFIASVAIERVVLALAPGTGNTAASASLTFTYEAQNFTETLDITVANVDGEAVDALVANSLRAVEADVQGLAEGTGPSAITVQGDVSNIQAGGARLVLDATLTLRLTITYYDCQDLAFGPFGPGAECITEENPLFPG